MKKIKATKQFKKDYKRIKSSQQERTIVENHLAMVSALLAGGKDLPREYKDHALIGEYIGHRECHIAPDLLIIYRIETDSVQFVRLGSHSELF